jgi:hypothetical protein
MHINFYPMVTLSKLTLPHLRKTQGLPVIRVVVVVVVVVLCCCSLLFFVDFS